MDVTFDWTSFSRKIYIKTDKKTLFDMWVDPDKIADWWLSGAAYSNPSSDIQYVKRTLKSDDWYEWKFPSNLVMKGTILDVKENQLLKFTFGDKYRGSEEKVIVTVEFFENEDEAWMELRQENIADDEYGRVYYNLSCQLGWTTAFYNLKSVIETGTDLRETDPTRVVETIGLYDG